MIPVWRRPAAQVAALIAATIALKGALSLELELTSAESYFWMCAKHPALGYFDHPGLAAWMIASSTALFGESVLAVRLFTILAGGLTVWFVFLAARRLYDERVGRLAAALVALAPLPCLWGAYALSYAPLLLFWSATLWALSHALGGGSPRWWIAAGAFLGLSMLGEYHAVFVGVGTLTFLLLSPDHRAWLRRKEPYLAAVVAVAVFSPTLAWNAANGWESFRYQGVSRFTERGFEAKQLPKFPAGQLLSMTPVVALWAWGAGLRTLFRWKSSSWQDRFSAALGMPVLLFFLALVFRRTVRPHWPTPGYLSVLVLSSAVLLRSGKIGRVLHAASLAVLGAVYVAAPIVLAFWPREESKGWARLADRVGQMRPQFVIARDYHHASQMGYHLHGRNASVDFTAVGEPSKSFPYWWKPEEFRGKAAVVVYDAAHASLGRDLLERCFDRVGEPSTVSIPWARWGPFGSPPEKFVLLRAVGYRPPRLPAARASEPPPD